MQVKEFYDYWNIAIERDGAKLKKVQAGRIGKDRFDFMAKRIQEFGLAKCMHAIDNATQSEFLNKEADASFSFDWFISYKNFTKVLEGNFSKCYRVNKLKSQEEALLKEDKEKDRGLVPYD